MSGRIRVTAWTPYDGARRWWDVYDCGVFCGCFWNWRDAMDAALALASEFYEGDE